MQRERLILVHISFLEDLKRLAAKNDAKFRKLVEDKARILSQSRDLARFTTKLRQESAKRLYGRFLHIDLRKRRGRLFALRWEARMSTGASREILLPFYITSDRDEVDYSDMRPYIHVANRVITSFENGQIDDFRIWFHDRTKMLETELPEWPFQKKRRKKAG